MDPDNPRSRTGAPDAASVAARVDEALPTSLLVYGSLPPHARDLELLARQGEVELVAGAFEEAGLVRSGQRFAAFGGGTAYGVELTADTSWKLPPAVIEELFAESLPIEGLQHLRRPAPAHVLLILARRLASSGSPEVEELRRRATAVTSEDAAAWARARSRADSWGVARALRALEGVHAGGRAGAAVPDRPLAQRSRRRAGALRRTRPLVVGLSGLNGAGKSSNAAALVHALTQLDVPSAVVWTPIGQSGALDVIARPAKKVLGRLRIGRLRQLAEPSATGPVFSNSVESAGANGQSSRVTAAWATFVALLNVFSQRRELARHVGQAHVIVYDRHALDSIVRLRFRYGDAGNLRLQRTLIRRAAPKPDLAYYLDVRPEIAYARKQNWTLEQLRVERDLYAEECVALGVQRVDGDASQEDISTQIAADVWRVLAKRR